MSPGPTDDTPIRVRHNENGAHPGGWAPLFGWYLDHLMIT